MAKRNGNDAVWEATNELIVQKHWGEARRMLDYMLENHICDAVDGFGYPDGAPAHVANRVAIWNQAAFEAWMG